MLDRDSVLIGRAVRITLFTCSAFTETVNDGFINAMTIDAVVIKRISQKTAEKSFFFIVYLSIR